MFTRIEENHGLRFKKEKTKVTRKRGAPGFRVGVREEQGLSEERRNSVVQDKAGKSRIDVADTSF